MYIVVESKPCRKHVCELRRPSSHAPGWRRVTRAQGKVGQAANERPRGQSDKAGGGTRLDWEPGNPATKRHACSAFKLLYS